MGRFPPRLEDGKTGSPHGCAAGLQLGGQGGVLKSIGGRSPPYRHRETPAGTPRETRIRGRIQRGSRDRERPARNFATSLNCPGRPAADPMNSSRWRRPTFICPPAAGCSRSGSPRARRSNVSSISATAPWRLLGDCCSCTRPAFSSKYPRCAMVRVLGQVPFPVDLPPVGTKTSSGDGRFAAQDLARKSPSGITCNPGHRMRRRCWSADARRMNWRRKKGIRLNLYAFRHSRITESLVNGLGCGNGLDTCWASRHLSMISRHYSHLTQKYRPDAECREPRTGLNAST